MDLSVPPPCERICLRRMFWQNSNISAKLDCPIWEARSSAFMPGSSGQASKKREMRISVEAADGFGISMRNWKRRQTARSEEHTSELQSLMRISYAVFCLKKTTTISKKNKSNLNSILKITHYTLNIKH